jgi:hypothetical protein
MVVVVVLVIGFNRLNAPVGAGSLTPVSPTTPASRQPLLPVSSQVLDDFRAASRQLDAANATVRQVLAAASTQSVTQVNEEIAPYDTALNTFLFAAHFLAWPPALQGPADNLTLRSQVLASHLSSLKSLNHAALTIWLSQLHALGRQTQAADNQLRRTLGMSPTQLYP